MPRTTNEEFTLTSYTQGYSSLYISPNGYRMLKKLLARGMNTWDEAPIDLKELHDFIIHGKLLQDYAALENYK